VPEGSHILGAGPPATAPEAEPGRRGLMFGILVYRLASFVLMVVLAALAEPRSGLALALFLAAIGCWVIGVSAARAWERPWVRWADLGISAGVLVAAPFLLEPGTVGTQPFFAAPYPLSTVMTWALARGVAGGVGAAVVLAVPLGNARWLNGSSWSALDGDDVLSIGTGVAYYLLGGLVVGLFTQTLLRAADGLRSANEEAARARERAARLRERETLARTIHDSVLQALAVVHRTGQELAGRDRVEPGEVAALVGLVDRQERELRTLLRDAPEDPPKGTVPLRTVLEAAAFGVMEVEVSVSTVEPAWLPASAAAEVSAAVRAALDNVVQHASANAVTIFGEADGEQLVLSIRDDGVGFDVGAARDAADGHYGISRSIRGRIADLGGDVRIDSAPGRGTEVEIRLPATAEGSG
jgi:signal transduction histidine kinase